MSQSSGMPLERPTQEGSSIQCQIYAPVFYYCHFNSNSRFRTDHTNSNNNHSVNYGIDPKPYPISEARFQGCCPIPFSWLSPGMNTAVDPSAPQPCRHYPLDLLHPEGGISTKSPLEFQQNPASSLWAGLFDVLHRLKTTLETLAASLLGHRHDCYRNKDIEDLP